MASHLNVVDMHTGGEPLRIITGGYPELPRVQSSKSVPMYYEKVLGPSMTYTCACFPTDEATPRAGAGYKYDLVARKLGLKPGMRLLDVGCGWGGMVRHAASDVRRQVVGVTLSREQAALGAGGIEVEGIDDLAEVRHGDYRDVPGADFDAVSAIGLIEHVGVENYPSYFPVPSVPAASRAGCSTTASPGRTTSIRGCRRAGSSAGTCSRTASSPVRRHRACHGGLGPRGASPGEPPGALRADLRAWNDNLVERWDECVGSAGLPSRGCGVSTRRFAVGLRAQRDPAPPGPGHPHRHRRHGAATRCGPTSASEAQRGPTTPVVDPRSWCLREAARISRGNPLRPRPGDREDDAGVLDVGEQDPCRRR